MRARESDRLSAKAEREVQRALKEVEKGRSYTHEEVRRMLFESRPRRHKPDSRQGWATLC